MWRGAGKADEDTEAWVESGLRLQTSVRLRWFAVAGQLLTVIVVYLWLGFDMPVGTCLLLIAVSAWLNVYLRLKYSPVLRLSPRFATVLLAYDILQLSALLFLTGGIDNPFVVLLVAPVTVSAATQPARNTVFVGSLALAMAALLAIVHYPLPWLADGAFQLPGLYSIGAFSAVAACLVFLAFYAWRLAKEARLMSSALAATELVLAREQRLHALDGLAAAAAHELGTPLATIVLVAGELERETKDTALAEDLALLKSQATRCREILQKLTRDPADRDPLHASMTLTQIADEAVAPYRRGSVTVQLRRVADAEASPEPVAERRPGVLFGVGNLIENAVDFAREQVEISVTWTKHTAELTIVDDGPGFPADVLEQLGDPYISARQAGAARAQSRRTAGGLGLGVFIAKTLLERSGARLEISNKSLPEQGAVVAIVWPRDRFEAAVGEVGPAGADRLPNNSYALL